LRPHTWLIQMFFSLVWVIFLVYVINPDYIYFALELFGLIVPFSVLGMWLCKISKRQNVWEFIYLPKVIFIVSYIIGFVVLLYAEYFFILN
jgi:hypothetical protein